MKDIMRSTLKSIIKSYGENDGIVTRIYLDDISRFIGGEIEDCLSVAVDNETDTLITFWQDPDDTYTIIDNYSSLSEHLQNSIYNQVFAEFGTKFAE